MTETILSEAKRGSARAICCLGLSYKADIDDLRESPSIDIVDMVSRRFDGPLFVVEPHIEVLPKHLQGSANLTLTGLRDGLEHSDIVVLLTDHKEFRAYQQMILKVSGSSIPACGDPSDKKRRLQHVGETSPYYRRYRAGWRLPRRGTSGEGV